MIGYNHALTGGVIAYYLPLPIALPFAFASHFVLDSLPHYGIPNKNRDRSSFWKIFFTLDTIATFALAIYTIYTKHYTMFLGGLVATMPDFLWLGRVIKTRSFDLSKNTNKFTKWHAKIQRYERNWGLAIELPYAAILSYIVYIRIWGL
ncbi:MAG TPA: hypothetical protein VIH90_02145 [Candidatus Saccharimonadales bacterium]